jgi:hypothetical protein
MTSVQTKTETIKGWWWWLWRKRVHGALPTG